MTEEEEDLKSALDTLSVLWDLTPFHVKMDNPHLVEAAVYLFTKYEDVL